MKTTDGMRKLFFFVENFDTVVLDFEIEIAERYEIWGYDFTWKWYCKWWIVQTDWGQIIMKSSIFFLTIALLLCMGYFFPCNAIETEIATDGEVDSLINEKKEADIVKEKEKIVKKNKKSQKDWSKVNFDSIDKAWEGGDDRRELDHDFEIRLISVFNKEIFVSKSC